MVACGRCEEERTRHRVSDQRATARLLVVSAGPETRRASGEGQGLAEIGDRLGISVNTVRNYIRNIYDKLHVHTKSQAVSKGLRRRLIP